MRNAFHHMLAAQTEIVVPGSGVRVSWLKQNEALVLSKSRSGFDEKAIESISQLLAAIEAGAFPELKFLVYDFSDEGPLAARPAKGFADMVAANASLIVDTPVITLAWARSLLSGPDFDFAMNCSAIIAEAGARFSLAGEPFELFGLYAALGRKIGFVRTERLIERDAILSATEAQELMIVKDVVDPLPGYEGVGAYLTQFERRYNASHAIFRAQRMAEPPIDRRPVDASERR